jgi:hypothetical protein
VAKSFDLHSGLDLAIPALGLALFDLLLGVFAGAVGALLLEVLLVVVILAVPAPRLTRAAG